MRNKFPGICYFCGHEVPAQAGHFERVKGGWRVIHAECVLKQRQEKAAKQQSPSTEAT